MRKMMATTLVVAHVLTGCGATTAVFSADTPAKQRTIGQSNNGQQRTVLPMNKVQNRTFLGGEDKATHGVKKPAAAGAGGASPAGTGESVQSAEAAETTGVLKLEKAPDEVNVVPILTESGDLDRLMFSPANGILTWEVAAEGAVSIKTVRITLQSIAEYPAPVRPDATASEGMPVGGLVERGGAPITVDLDTAALNWPVQLKSGTRSKLAFKLDTEAFRDFLAKSYGTARVTMKLQFLDGAGMPIADAQGKAFTLDQTLDIL